jgi:hypothetical protein
MYIEGVSGKASEKKTVSKPSNRTREKLRNEGFYNPHSSSRIIKNLK